TLSWLGKMHMRSKTADVEPSTQGVFNEYKFQVLTGNIKCFLNSSTSSGIFLWHGWLLHVQHQLLQLFLRRPCHRLILSVDSRCLSLQTLPVFVQSFLGLPAWSLRSKLSPLGLVFGYCGSFLQVPSVPFPRG